MKATTRIRFTEPHNALMMRGLRALARTTAALGVGFSLMAISAAVAQEAVPDNPVGITLLPRDLSPWGMFQNADIVVQGVLVGLVVASVITWTVWLAKTLELWGAKRRVRADLNWLGRLRTSEGSLERLVKARSMVGKFMTATVAELQLSCDALDKDGIKKRIASRLCQLRKRRAGNTEVTNDATPALTSEGLCRWCLVLRRGKRE